ncbi:hypothetical protein DMT40_15680 [Klebsiella variicola]|nr:hypothetical protein DMT40_15680 [Klebsiella variicola]
MGYFTRDSDQTARNATGDQPRSEERPMPTESTLIGSEYTSTRSRYGSAYHPSNNLRFGNN